MEDLNQPQTSRRQLSEGSNVSVPAPPPLPPPSSPSDETILIARRARRAEAVLAEPDLTTALASEMAAINATVVDATMTELQAEVRLSHTAIGSSDADSLSLAFFTELLNVSGLMTDLSSLLPAEAVLIDKLEVETCYTLSNCIIMKQLWPPPPPAEPTVTFGSLQLTVETVQAITSSISTFVAGSVATTAAS